MAIEFIYFDLGNVLLNFDHERACQQIAEVAETTSERIREIVFDSGLEWQYEAGKISSREFYEAVCEALGSRPDYDRMARAGSDIFKINGPAKAVFGKLVANRRRVGVLSNTNEMHWSFVTSGRFTMIPEDFEVTALSYEIGAIKPDPKIFTAAAELAGVAPKEIFFTDDMPGHVEAACAAGFDAVQFTTATKLAEDLRQRGVRLNY
jgi:HAD superfamily hydrolase (TIGR01509 family)